MPSFGRVSALGALVCAAVAFIIAPVAMSAFLSDDQFNSTVNGWLAEYHISVTALAWQITLDFFHANARFLPGFYLQAYGLFHLAPGLAEYKAVQVAMLALDFALFAVFLRTLGLHAGTVALAVLFALTTVQFHGHFDGYLGFSGTNEFLLILSLGSWILFAAFLRRENLWLLWGALVLFAASVLSYEMCYLLSIVHVLIAIRARGRAGWRAALPFLVVTAAAFVQLEVARILNPQQGAHDYALRFAPDAYLRTIFNQVSASLPLMFLAFHHELLFGPGHLFGTVSPPWILLPLALCSGFAAYLSLRGMAERPRGLIVPAAIGVWVWVEAAFLISAIPRYQREISIGFGYSPVVIAGFGAAIVLTCAAAALLARVPEARRTPVSAAFAVVFALVLTASFETNQRTLETFESERAAILNVVAALDHGVASTVPDGATLLVAAPAQLLQRNDEMRSDAGGLSNPKFFVRQHSGKALRVRGMFEIPPAVPCASATCEVRGTYAMHDVPLDVRDGYTVLGTVRRVGTAADGTLQPWSDGLRVHLRGDRLARVAAESGISLAYTCAAENTLHTVPLRVDAAAVRGGTVIAPQTGCLVDLDAVILARTGG